MRVCTDIHTTPTKLINELLNPNSSIRLNGIKKSGGGEGVPPSRIVYDSTTIDNTASLAIEDLDNNNSNVDGKALAGGGGENNKRTVVMATYRASPTKKDQLLEFLRKYETWGLAEGGFVIGFCTINPKDLPPGSVAPEEYQKGITDGKWEVIPGWAEMGNYVLREKEYGQTDVEYNLVVDVDPSLMTNIKVNYYFKEQAQVLTKAREVYDRSEEVDLAENANFINNTIPNSPELTREEQAIINNSLKFMEKSFTRMKTSKDSDVEMFQILSSTDAAWGKAVGIVDAPAERCLGWVFGWCSNKRMIEHVKKNGHVLRSEYDIPDSHSKIVSAVMRFPKGFDNREFHNWLVWAKLEEYNGHEAYVMAFAPREECDVALLPPLPTFLDQSNTTVGKTIGIYIFERLAPQITRMTFVQQAEMRGSIPPLILNSLVRSSLQIVQRLVDDFKRRGRDVDEEKRNEFISNIHRAPPLTPDQNDLVKRCLQLENVDAGEFKEINSKDYRVKFFQKYDPTIVGEKNVAVGKAAAKIDASAEEVLAWRWNWCSNDKMRIHREDDTSLTRSVVKEVSMREIIVETTKRFPRPFNSRQFVV